MPRVLEPEQDEIEAGYSDSSACPARLAVGWVRFALGASMPRCISRKCSVRSSGGGERAARGAGEEDGDDADRECDDPRDDQEHVRVVVHVCQRSIILTYEAEYV